MGGGSVNGDHDVVGSRRMRKGDGWWIYYYNFIFFIILCKLIIIKDKRKTKCPNLKPIRGAPLAHLGFCPGFTSNKGASLGSLDFADFKSGQTIHLKR